MIELVVQIDSKIKACCHIMQPIGNRLVPSMLDAGAKRKIELVKFFCENKLGISNGSFFPPAFFSFFFFINPSQRLTIFMLKLFIPRLSVKWNAKVCHVEKHGTKIVFSNF